MVALLAVLGLVIDDAVLDFDVANVEMVLEVGGIVQGILEAEIDAHDGPY